MSARKHPNRMPTATILWLSAFLSRYELFIAYDCVLFITNLYFAQGSLHYDRINKICVSPRYLVLSSMSQRENRIFCPPLMPRADQADSVAFDCVKERLCWHLVGYNCIQMLKWAETDNCGLTKFTLICH